VNTDELRQHARDLVADWPPLTDHQQAVIVAMMKPVERSGKNAPAAESGKAA
jgi:hypothetical protein